MRRPRFAALLFLGLAAVPGRAGVREIVDRADEAVLTVRVRTQAGQGVGSAVLVNPHGYALTNAHVVDGSDKVLVILRDGRKFDATVIRRDERRDLALLRLSSGNLPVVAVGDAKTLRAGDDVVAIGAPKGLDHTVTRGIVSTASRRINGQSYIQTDAALNPGNSGGPLLNDRAEVVGINTLIDKDAAGVGFAVPINAAYDMLREAGVAVSTPLTNEDLSASPIGTADRPMEKAAPQRRPTSVYVVAGCAAAVLLAIIAALLIRRRRRRLRKVPVTLHPSKPREEADLDITLH